MAARYTVETTTDVALSAATAKSILGVIGASNAPFRVIEFGVSFDGTSGTATPVTVELCSVSTTSAGTSTSQTPVQTGGVTRTVQASGKRNYTAEPTTITVLKRYKVHPQSGIVIQFPLGREPEISTSGYGCVIRVTAAATVNAQGYIEFEEG